MMKFLKPGKVVILLQGRYAGKKAVIVCVFEEGTRDRLYRHCLVAGLAKYPKKVICKDSSKKTAKKSRVKVFFKLVNFTHPLHPRHRPQGGGLRRPRLPHHQGQEAHRRQVREGQARGEVQDWQEEVVLHQDLFFT
ncbi:60S ribosomal protein L27-3 [Hordeum vulgare]|nr:60S ribosomal protein L27-3 [Hordeum vulgare]